MNNEAIFRWEQFCQIKSEIRGSDDYLVVGIDVAKDKHHAFMGTANGEDWYINLDEKLIVTPCEDEQTRCVFKIVKK